MNRTLTAFTAALVFAASVPSAAAAEAEVTASVKKALDKTIASADHARAGKLSAFYKELMSVQSQDSELTSRVKAQNAANKTAISALNKQIKQIDAPKLARLEEEVKSVKERYAPLLARYTQLNKQLDLSRSVGTKELSSLLRLQLQAMKIPVQLARLSIKAKEAALKSAKDKAGQTAKKIRGSLEAVEPLQAQIKTKQSVVKSIDSNMTPLWSSFKQAVKKQEAESALSTLTSVVSMSGQIVKEKQHMLTLEQKIRDVVAAAKAQLP
ncbi:hypothetical protein SAMN02799630_00815 [Paenibacillus sp. UNCCL117]|uniref:hypothetical protein n=1 Tax=unclassified Paenibacillus TaxID=185978 RepID=UPI00088E9571|nr:MULTISPECIES: hypothetical protein [unclassified Paenibacillus]SDC21400.1 hypothetical protein SAMN04488602_101615 [Paenibacillus sp. cl123]SFW18811.1 hypothetical protein SAMN02799630_00815 [Paenibacillus sp. UNCCL117]